MNYIRKHSGVHRLGEHRSNSVVHFTRASTGVRVPLGTRFGGGEVASGHWELNFLLVKGRQLREPRKRGLPGETRLRASAWEACPFVLGSVVSR